MRLCGCCASALLYLFRLLLVILEHLPRIRNLPLIALRMIGRALRPPSRPSAAWRVGRTTRGGRPPLLSLPTTSAVRRLERLARSQDLRQLRLRLRDVIEQPPILGRQRRGILPALLGYTCACGRRLRHCLTDTLAARLLLADTTTRRGPTPRFCRRLNRLARARILLRSSRSRRPKEVCADCGPPFLPNGSLNPPPFCFRMGPTARLPASFYPFRWHMGPDGRISPRAAP